MEKVYENRFNTIYYDEKKSLVKMVRHEATKEMKEDEYKIDMIRLKDVGVETKANFVLMDNRQLYFIITPHVQEWANNEIVIPSFQNFAQKVAFIEGEDLFANISAQQAMEDNENLEKQYRFFDNEEDALKWLFS